MLTVQTAHHVVGPGEVVFAPVGFTGPCVDVVIITGISDFSPHTCVFTVCSSMGNLRHWTTPHGAWDTLIEKIIEKCEKSDIYQI